MPKANILIVEDEAVVAADLAGKLERAGYRSVGIAADGEDAVGRALAFARVLSASIGGGHARRP